MNLKVLGISTSPRTKGNSDLLLRQALAGAESVGAQIEYIHLVDYNIGPCIECNACYTTDRLIFATPIFFMTVCAQAKMLIDRGQCLWAHQYVLKKKLFNPERDRRAMVIAVGGSKGIKQFDSIRRTMKAYFDALQIQYSAGLYVNQVENRDDVEKHPSALKEAFRLGSVLADSENPVQQKPIDIELT